MKHILRAVLAVAAVIAVIDRVLHSVILADAYRQTMPLPVVIPVAWFLGGMAECLVAGAVAGMIYKP